MLESCENVANRCASWGDAGYDVSGVSMTIWYYTVAFIPAILNSGGGKIPCCEGPDGLEVPGLITAVACKTSYHNLMSIKGIGKTYVYHFYPMAHR